MARSLDSQFGQSQREIGEGLWRKYLEYSRFWETEPETVRDQHCVGWDAVSFNLKETKPDRPAPQGLEIPKNFICPLRRSSP
jgi:hypothetical protein